MHDMICLWISKKFKKNHKKIYENVDQKPIILSEKDIIKDCFGVTSFYHNGYANKDNYLSQLYIPNLQILVLKGDFKL